MKPLEHVVRDGEKLDDIVEGVARKAVKAADDAPVGGVPRIHPDVPPYTGGKVQGVLRAGGRDQPLISGEDGPGRWLKDNLQGGPGSGLTRAWTHVEGHSAGYMHQHGISQAELFINKVPCETGAAKCRYVLNKLLPGGSTLDVHFPRDGGGVGTWRFTAGQPGWSELA